jgi:hypothetical protein
MDKFHSIAALCGDGLRPELRALFERLAVDPHSGLRIRHDGMIQAGPDPASETSDDDRPCDAPGNGYRQSDPDQRGDHANAQDDRARRGIEDGRHRSDGARALG